MATAGNIEPSGLLNLDEVDDCCAGAKSCCSTNSNGTTKINGDSLNSDNVTHEDVSDYYGKFLQSKDDLQTSACCLEGEESKETRQAVRKIHPEILSKFYGCGSPLPQLLKGCVVLDLGCGTGKDVYTASQLVGEDGRVIGIDMTDEQLSVARKYEEYHREKFGYKKSNVEFRRGIIENLKIAGVEDESADVVISNCVLNLATDKESVFREIFRVLKPGGELYFADVYSDRRIPVHLQKDKVLFGECLSGALYVSDFRRIMFRVGLGAWGPLQERQLSINNAEMASKIGPVRFYSITVRAIKVPEADVEDYPEDYGQVAVYKGSIPYHAESFELDSARVFVTNVPTPVDSTTASMLISSRYAPAFEVREKSNHCGSFDKWPKPLLSVAGGLGSNEVRSNPLASAPCGPSCC